MRNTRKLQCFSRRKCIPDLDRAVIVKTNDVARYGGLDQFALTSFKRYCVRNSDVFIDSDMAHFHAFFVAP